MSSKELNTENKNKIRQEAIKRLKGQESQLPPKDVVDSYCELLENLWMNDEIAFDWEIQ